MSPRRRRSVITRLIGGSARISAARVAQLGCGIDLGILALICAAALLGPALSLLSHGVLPAVVGQLLAGVILGRTLLDVVHPADPALLLLYDIGFATLMFTVGTQVPLHDRRLRGALAQGARAALAAVPLSLAAGMLCHLVGSGPALVYAVVIASSSAAVALPVIQEGRLEGPVVLAALAWITLADIAATLAIPLALTPDRALHAAGGALIVIACVAALVAIAFGVRHAPLLQRIRHEGKKRGWALDLRVAVIALLGLSYLALQVGASLLVAGFGVGLVVGALGGPKRLSREILGLGQGFFIPVFFVLLGARLDLRALIHSPQAVALAVLLAALTIIVHVAAARAIGARPAIGLLASAQMGVPAAAIALGLPSHAIDQRQASAIFCAALISIGACAAGAAILRAQPSAPDDERSPPEGPRNDATLHQTP
jgi:Kef-type K+ transport system membrane component KefB